jgi:hypothetical protein
MCAWLIFDNTRPSVNCGLIRRLVGIRLGARERRLGSKPIPDAWNGDDYPRLLGVGLDLSAETANVHIDRAVEGLSLTAGDSIQESFSVHYPTRAARECQQQIKLPPPQLDLATGRKD